MALANALRRVSRQLIRRFGSPATLTRTTSTIDPVDGVTQQTTTAYPGQCVVEEFSDYLVDGQTIKTGDRRIIFAAAALPVEPSPLTTMTGGKSITDQVTVDGATFEVLRVFRVSVEGHTVTWTIHGRQ